jgi:hypothetical protein
MQYSMHNQCSSLFTCIMHYLHALCMILIVLSYVLCMILMVFIYVYYVLFACINLVDVMLLFFTVFRSIYQFSAKIIRFLAKFTQKSRRRFSEKLIDLSVKSAYFWSSQFSLFLCHLRCILSRIFLNSDDFFLNFSKIDGIG